MRKLMLAAAEAPIAGLGLSIGTIILVPPTAEILASLIGTPVYFLTGSPTVSAMILDSAEWAMGLPVPEMWATYSVVYVIYKTIKE